ncbi:MAG TPA: SpoIIE family protein phosphatase [Vicinamibacterales bacterium]|nr:SpoIIE family protein phosphatase [Vicinamibacterales bacterium]
MTTPPAPRARLFRTLPGRLFILSSVPLVILLLTQSFVTLPELLVVFRKVLSLASVVSIVCLAVMAIARSRRRFLWRVRRKLILSYIFLGFVPVLLVFLLAMAAALTLYMDVAGYMFHEGFTDISNDVQQAAETTAAEVGRSPASAIDAVTRKYDNLSSRYPALSLAVIPLSDASRPSRPVVAGPWKHAAPPADAPDWLSGSAGGFKGVVAVLIDGASPDWELVMRSVVPTRDRARAVVADLPVDAQVAAEIEARTKARMGAITVPESCDGPGISLSDQEPGTLSSLFRKTVGFVDCRSWQSGKSGQVTISIDAPLTELYGQMASLRANALREAFVIILVFVAVLFLIVQGAALVMGWLLARSITYAVNELSIGTERIQKGEFSYRIKIDSNDQLGELAQQYNRMSSGMEHLLHVQREKQRLDDELRIARDIQKSLLPASPPSVPGMTIADLCEPAREVGGDYYDFFDLGEGRLAVMVADVSGKGTSAALYMAELKGLMLALTRRESSPRRLLIEANRLLAAHLDNRNFITMTYAIVDLQAGTLTCARAGHTPMIVVTNGASEVVAPPGMVLGLRLPQAAERFADLLEEYTRPIKAGDVIVLYTDGITEAMNETGEFYSDEALAEVVVGQHELDAAGIRERVVREVFAFVGNAEPHDDMTMIVLKIGALGPARIPAPVVHDHAPVSPR